MEHKNIISSSQCVTKARCNNFRSFGVPENYEVSRFGFWTVFIKIVDISYKLMDTEVVFYALRVFA